jgi:hypothetical protein
MSSLLWILIVATYVALCSWLGLTSLRNGHDLLARDALASAPNGGSTR